MSTTRDTHLDSLYSAKAKKLASQKALSDEFHDIVNKLANSNLQERKNLAAAIAVSKKPGYFEYYQPPAEIKGLESGNVLKKLAAQISKVNHEIEQLNDEIATKAVNRRDHVGTSQAVELSKVSQWFDVYGRPSHIEDDRLTCFVPTGKVYGGSTHYSSFKSLSSTMRKGRITN